MAMCFNTLLALVALCTLISSCSPAAGIPASSTGLAPAGYSTAHVSKERVTITEFADLPEGYAYGPTAIASGPDKSLWVAVCPGFVLERLPPGDRSLRSGHTSKLGIGLKGRAKTNGVALT